MAKATGIQRIAGILIIIGAINWGLIGIFDYNVVNAILGNINTLERIVYSLVGLSGLAALLNWCKCTGGKK